MFNASNNELNWYQSGELTYSRSNLKMTYIDNSSSCFDNLQQYNNCLARHCDMKIISPFTTTLHT